MASLTIGGKTVFTQTGTDEPVLSSDVTGTLGSGIVIGNDTTFPSGHVIQVKSDSYDVYNTTTATSATAGLKILEVPITPKFSSSIFHINCSISVCHRDYYTGFGTFFENVNNAGETAIFLSTDSNLASFQQATITFRYGAAQDSSTDNIFAPYIISYNNIASTIYTLGQEIKYSLRLWTNDSSQPVYINRGISTSSSHYGRSICTMSIMEISNG